VEKQIKEDWRRRQATVKASHKWLK